MIRFHMPKLRIYQQILICFGLIVTVPLVSAAFIIYNINQYALKKELSRFTEHTAEALYRDFGTEMSWQRQQVGLMSRLTADELAAKRPFESVAAHAMSLDPELNVVALYNASGHLLNARYRRFEALSPDLRLADDLPRSQNGTPPPFQVIYYDTGRPQDSPYFLRAVIPLPSNTDQAKYYVQQKNFKYLQNLVRTNNSLYDAFYIVDADGVIIAGPSGADQKERISAEDYDEFARIRPGVTHDYESAPQSAQQASGDSKPDDDDDNRPLKKVIVKMPDINWGIIIESPYHVKQRYIKNAGTNTLLIILACLAVMVLLVLPYIIGISRNFRQLIKGVKAMGEGNYYRRIRLISNFFTPYEIVYLTLEFNRMARKVADSWQAIQQANRQLEQLDEFKSNLIDTVSHELRTPLTSIKGYTSRLIRYDSSLDSETRLKSLKVVKQQADRLGRLVEDLLVIPDLESAGLRVYPDQVPLMPLLENAVQFVQARASHEGPAGIEHELSIRLNYCLEHPVSVLADPDRLEQILLNLLDNAVKYSIPHTPIEVRVEPGTMEAPSLHAAAADDVQAVIGEIHIFVVNTCEPFPEDTLDELDTLFDKFKRLDDSLVRTTRGSGLGLFITRGLVEAMGGEIQLQYQDDQFTVHFTIPLYQPEKSALALAE